MRTRSFLTSVAPVVVLALLNGCKSAPASSSEGTAKASTPPPARSYAALPLAFERNEGQVPDEQVQFVARASSGRISIGARAVAFAFPGARGADVRMTFVGASATAEVVGSEPLSSKTNHLIGADAAKWRTNVPNVAKVRVRDLYKGVDVVYYGNQSRLEYDFVVHPGADASQILLAFDGADELSTDEAGNLAVRVGSRVLDVKLPTTYQEKGGKREEVRSRFVVDGKRARVEIGDYDRALALVIDPLIQYASYLGGTGLDAAAGIDVDEVGNIYVTGSTLSSDFPSVSGHFSATNAGGKDVFVTKIKADGSAILWSTYIGGSGDDVGWGLRHDRAGEIYLSGTSTSPNFPTAGAAPGSQSCTVTRLSADGSKIVWSKHLGGKTKRPGNDNPLTLPTQSCYAVELGPDRGPTVVGNTNTTDFPTTAGVAKAAAANATSDTDDGFVTHLSSTGDVIWSTLVGGSKFDSTENIASFSVDASGNTFFVGQTGSTDFPSTEGTFQSTNPTDDYSGFVAKLNSTGTSYVYATYLGGGGSGAEPRRTEPLGITTDTAGNAFVVGMTSSAQFPVKGAFQARSGGGFVAKLDPTGKNLIWSTVFGGTSPRNPVADDRHWKAFFTAPIGVALDSAGNIDIVGVTETTDFPIVKGTHAAKGLTDAFFAQVSADGATLLYSDLFGGTETGDKGFEFIAGIRSTSGGTNVRVAGGMSGADFPTTPGALQRTYAGPATGVEYYGDGFIMSFTPPCDGAFGSKTSAACIGRTTPVCPTSGPETGICQPCDGDKGAAGQYTCHLAKAPRCLTPALGGLGQCVECTVDADCNGAVCNVATHTCGCDGSYGAATAHACSDPTTPVCPVGGATPGVCHACDTDWAGGGIFACQMQSQPYCVKVEGALDQGACVLCTSNDHCFGGECDESIHECRKIPVGGKCNSNIECEKNLCTNGLCADPNADAGVPVGDDETGTPCEGDECAPGDDDSGCGCVTAPSRSRLPILGVFASIAFALALSRRRSRR